MNSQQEKILLLQGIQKLTQEMNDAEPTLELFMRYSNLVSCLVALNWRECGHRRGEGSFAK